MNRFRWISDASRWRIWVAEVDGQIVAHMFVQLVEKVPRPHRSGFGTSALIMIHGFSGRSTKPLDYLLDKRLFASTPRGATASTITYSIIEKGKEDGLIPFAYLEYLFEQLPNLQHPNSLDSFFPWSDKLPSRARGTRR